MGTTRREFLKLLGITVVAASIDPIGMVDAAPMVVGTRPDNATTKLHRNIHRGTLWTGTIERTRDVRRIRGIPYVEGPWETTANLSLTTDDVSLMDAIGRAFQNRDRVRLDTSVGSIEGEIAEYSIGSDSDIDGSFIINVEMFDNRLDLI